MNWEFYFACRCVWVWMVVCLCLALWWSGAASRVSPCLHQMTAGSLADPCDPECSMKYWKWYYKWVFGLNCLVVSIRIEGSRTSGAVSLCRAFARIKGGLLYKTYLTRRRISNVSLACWSVSQHLFLLILDYLSESAGVTLPFVTSQWLLGLGQWLQVVPASAPWDPLMFLLPSSRRRLNEKDQLIAGGCKLRAKYRRVHAVGAKWKI